MTLIAQSISFSIGKTLLLKELSYIFSRGDLVAILGPNGSGKTTLLKLLSSLLPPSSGKIFLDGKPLIKLDRESISQTITYVPQNPSLTFPFTVEQFIIMGGYLIKNSKKSPNESLAKVDALHLKQRVVKELSQGERQRIYLARALYTDASFLLLDEPTASLDLKHREMVWGLLNDLAKNGKGVIAATHDLNYYKAFCSKCLDISALS